MVGKPLMPSPSVLRKEKKQSVSKVKGGSVSKEGPKVALVSQSWSLKGLLYPIEIHLSPELDDNRF